MRYTSTRDHSVNVSFEQALTSGYAPGGGLFVPAEFNLAKFSTEDLRRWKALSYAELAYEIMRRFISVDEISDGDLRQIFADSYSDFEREEVVPVVPLKLDDEKSKVYVSELFHGPTYCFKDLGMKACVNLLAYFGFKRKRRTTLVVSTTGDTGPAAMHAVCGLPEKVKPYLNILVHFPKGQISKLQRRQLTCIDSPNARVVAFEGGGDDMDIPIKRILLASHSGDDVLCGINSYNIGRPLTQMVHFVWTYLRVAEREHLEIGDSDQKVDIVLPTGAMGNIAGGYMAKKLGLPLGFLCAGVNINDITHRTFTEGEFHKSEGMEKTLSEAINIQVPYNFERLLYYLSSEDARLVRMSMTNMDSTQKLTLSNELLMQLKLEFLSARVTDEEMCIIIREVYEKMSYLIDPHTAIAVAAATKLSFCKLGISTISSRPSRNPVALLATASPCKFEESVTTAIGTQKWNSYVQESEDFPKTALKLINLSDNEEIPPIIYDYISDATLEENQLRWQEMAELIIENFSNPSFTLSENNAR